MFRAFKYELSPNQEQIALMSKQFGCVRFVYNWGLSEKIKAYKEFGKNLSCIDLSLLLTKKKKEQEFLWLSEAQAQSLQMSLRNLDNSYTSFFNNNGRFPKFKKKSNTQSFQYPQKVKIEENKIYLPKIGWVDFYKSRECFGKIKTVTVSKTPTGRHFVSILCDTGVAIPEKTEIKKAVGIDLGIKTFAVTSDGEVFENQKHLQKSLKKLRVEQRSLARKKKGFQSKKQAAPASC